MRIFRAAAVFDAVKIRPGSELVVDDAGTVVEVRAVQPAFHAVAGLSPAYPSSVIVHGCLLSLSVSDRMGAIGLFSLDGPPQQWPPPDDSNTNKPPLTCAFGVAPGNAQWAAKSFRDEEAVGSNPATRLQSCRSGPVSRRRDTGPDSLGESTDCLPACLPAPADRRSLLPGAEAGGGAWRADPTDGGPNGWPFSCGPDSTPDDQPISFEIEPEDHTWLTRGDRTPANGVTRLAAVRPDTR
jgi:hypothetical protein